MAAGKNPNYGPPTINHPITEDGKRANVLFWQWLNDLMNRVSEIENQPLDAFFPSALELEIPKIKEDIKDLENLIHSPAPARHTLQITPTDVTSDRDIYDGTAATIYQNQSGYPLRVVGAFELS